MAKLRVGVLVSGAGTTLQTLIDLCIDPSVPAEIVTVISNRPGVMALERAARAGIQTRVIRHRSFPERALFDQALDQALRADGVELVCLAGFMRILTASFVDSWRNRMLNIHPALLPSFRGLHTHRQALDAGVRFHGCTIHIVRPELDAGPIIVQGVVPVLPGDDEDRLSARVRQAERRAYPLALRLFAEGRVEIEGDRVTIRDQPVPTERPLLNPTDLPSGSA